MQPLYLSTKRDDLHQHTEIEPSTMRCPHCKENSVVIVIEEKHGYGYAVNLMCNHCDGSYGFSYFLWRCKEENVKISERDRKVINALINLERYFDSLEDRAPDWQLLEDSN